MAKFFNRARMTTATTGTGTITLGTAFDNSYMTFAEAGVANGNVVPYVIEDGTNVECGVGTYTSSGTTFSRDTVRISKIGGTQGTSKINLSGTANIRVDVLKEDLISFSETQSANNFLGGPSSGSAAIPGFRAITSGDLPRWTLTVVKASNSTWPVPAGTTDMMLEVWGGGGAGGSQTGGTVRGGGGAAGSYGFKHYTGTMDSTLNITIGAGGASATGGAQNAGSATSVVGSNLGTLSAPGGGGCPPGANAGGASGGAGSGFDYTIAGGDGQANGGTAGVNFFGGGGSAPRGGPGGASNVATPGTEPGGGGSGENHVGGGSGAGAKGWVFIWTR